MLISSKVNINHAGSSGCPAILNAVAFVKSPSLTRLLVDNGADLTKTTSRGRSLLHWAAMGPPEIMRTLLGFAKCLKLDARDDDGQTPLHLGSSYTSSDLDCLRLLVLAGADVNAKDRREECPLHNAVRCKRTALISLLINQPEIEIDSIGSWGTALQLACRRRNMSAIRTLLDHDALVNLEVPKRLSGTALMAALQPEHASRDRDGLEIDDLVRELVISRGADVKQKVAGNVFHTALSAACLAARTGTIHFLIQRAASYAGRADPDPVFGRLPLHFAAANGIENFGAVSVLLLGNYGGDMAMMRPDGSGAGR